MKFVVCIVLDQTVGYLTEDGSVTTKHPEAWLHGERALAQAEVEKHDKTLRTHWDDGSPVPEGFKERYSAWIEDVPDEAVFRAQEDTW